jgi:ribosomal-protein-alanine N-acetyltransferase
MRAKDIDSVAAIERMSFPTPYTVPIFRYELRNRHSSWWVVRPQETQASDNLPPVLTYVGYHLDNNRAHIAKIATHPEWRRRKLGAWTLLNMLLAARGEGAAYVTLEVRNRNTAAQRFYFKFRFIEIERIKGYYQDTGDDGRILALLGLDTRAVSTWLLQEMNKISIDPPETACKDT